jgi:GNAT superfamily N-acetyltransferase
VLRGGGRAGTIQRMTGDDTGTVLKVRQAVPDDWATLRQLRLAALAEAPQAFSSTLDREIDHPEEFWRARIAAWPQFIAWADGEPVGIAAGFAEPAGDDQAGAGIRGSWHLVSMWVSPRARGRGIADDLVTAVSDCARADDARRITLWVTDVNERARAFYLRMGFRSTGRRQLVRPEEPDHWEEEQALDLS